MSIYDFMDYCVDAGMCHVVIYSFEKEDNVWSGYGDEIPEEYGDETEFSFDVPSDGSITFNIN